MRYCGILVQFTLALFHNALFSLAGFAETPSSVMVELGMTTPPFRCRHNSSEAITYWRVNGSMVPSRQFPDIRSGFVIGNGTKVYTLNIPARSDYNGTEVVCLAVYLDGSPIERTPPATLIFTASMISTMTPGPPTSEQGHFEVAPSPLTVAVEQGIASFQCQHSLADVIGWRVNGKPLNVVNLGNISSSTVTVYTVDGATMLSIGTHLEYNGTIIDCVAIFFNGSPPQFSVPVALLVQDTPGQVMNAAIQRNHSLNSLMIFWNPLPSLDISDTDPDIVYTVELFRITCGQNVLISHSVMAGSNAVLENLDLMQIYKAVVAARNNVPEARNGPSMEMEEIFMPFKGFTLFKLARSVHITVTSHDPVPSYYTMVLESLYSLGQNITITNITVERNRERINIHIEERLPTKSLWEASIFPYGCEADIIMVTELSTHDIQNVTVSFTHPGQIRVMGDFVDGSTATGVLLIIYSLINESDVHYIAKQTYHNYKFSISPIGLTETEYGVSVFVLENGLPIPGVVTSPKNVDVISVTDNDQVGAQELQFVEYELNPTSTGVCIICNFLDSSTTDCVAVVHQRISQLSSNGLMNIESSHKFNRSGDTAYGCIEGVDLEQYQVGVVGGSKLMHFSSPGLSYCLGCIGIISAAILGTVMLVGIVLSLFICCVKICSSNQGDRKLPAESEVNVEMQRCGAYEVVQLSRQRVTMKDNPAYVDVNLHTPA